MAQTVKNLPAMQETLVQLGIRYLLQYSWASLVAQLVKNRPAMQQTWVLSLCQEDPLEKGMAPHSSILARRTPQTEEPDRLQSMGILQARILERVAISFSRVSSQPRDQTQVSHIAGRFFTV